MPDVRDSRLPFRTLAEDFLAPRDPVLGYVKIGGKGEVRYTRDGAPWVVPTRYIPARFEVTTREKDLEELEGRGNSKGKRFTVDRGYRRDKAFHDRIEDQAPTRLRVRLMYPRVRQNLVTFLGAWGASSWACRGNGAEAIDEKRGEVPCPCPRLKQFTGEYAGGPFRDGGTAKKPHLYTCKPHGRLHVILEDAEVFGGFWVFQTTSYETISNLTKALQTCEELFGSLAGLPLELRVQAATKRYDGGTTTQPIVTLVVPAAMDSARQLAAAAAEETRKYLPVGRELEEERYLEAVVEEMEAEARSYAREFLPEEEGGEEGTPELQEEDEGPDHEIVEDGPEEEAEAAGDPVEPEADADPPGDPDRNDPPDEEEAAEGAPDPFAAIEKVCRAVLAMVGFDEAAIDSRITYHRSDRSADDLDALAERLERNYPTEWGKVMAPDFFGGSAAEPEDGLPT